MSKNLMSSLLAYFLIMTSALMAAPADRDRVDPLTDARPILIPLTFASCAMLKATGNGTFICDSIESGMGFFTYFDPSADCAESPAYPFEITAFTFVLYDFADVGTATVDIVVYDTVYSGSKSGFPGTETCRMAATVTTFISGSATVTYSFPTPCCVDGPFYIGVEYPDADGMTTPSIVMDEEPLYDGSDMVLTKYGVWVFWGDYFPWPPPGDPLYYVEGETISASCGAPCDCDPGDANGDGDAANVGDAVYMINFVFKYGPPPTPYPICSGDANCDCQANVGDAVYIINYVFKGGPPPCDCPTWLLNCGAPLRK